MLVSPQQGVVQAWHLGSAQAAPEQTSLACSVAESLPDVTPAQGTKQELKPSVNYSELAKAATFTRAKTSIPQLRPRQSKIPRPVRESQQAKPILTARTSLGLSQASARSEQLS